MFFLCSYLILTFHQIAAEPQKVRLLPSRQTISSDSLLFSPSLLSSLSSLSLLSFLSLSFLCTSATQIHDPGGGRSASHLCHWGEIGDWPFSISRTRTQHLLHYFFPLFSSLLFFLILLSSFLLSSLSLSSSPLSLLSPSQLRRKWDQRKKRRCRRLITRTLTPRPSHTRRWRFIY